MARNVIAELAPFVAGTPVDQVAMRARRAQQSEAGYSPRGLPGYSARSAPAPAAPATPARQPSLAELLFANSTRFDQAGVVGSIPPTDIEKGGTWISARDLPANVLSVLGVATPQGQGFAGFDTSKISDPQQLQLLGQWYASGKAESDARVARAAQSDPKYREQLRQAQAMAPEEE